MNLPRKSYNTSSSFLPTNTPHLRKRGSSIDTKTTSKIISPLESSFSFRERISFCDLSDDEDDTSLSNNPIGPKNLLNVSFGRLCFFFTIPKIYFNSKFQIFEEIESEGNGDNETF